MSLQLHFLGNQTEQIIKIEDETHAFPVSADEELPGHLLRRSQFAESELLVLVSDDIYVFFMVTIGNKIYVDLSTSETTATSSYVEYAPSTWHLLATVEHHGYG